MTNDPLVNVTRVLATAISDPGDVSELPPARDEAIGKLADALRARAQARKRRRIVASFAVAAAVLGFVGAGVLGSRHTPIAITELGRVSEPAAALTVVRDGHLASLGASGEVAEGTELRTPAQAEARLDFTSGTKVTIGGGTHLRLVEQSKKKRFALESGSFSAKVMKLGPDERFVVSTSDAEVEVHGTEFRVSVVEPNPSCGDGTPTRLQVTEGVVAIRHAGVETLVTAGGTWPRCDVVGAGPPSREPGEASDKKNEASGVATSASAANARAITTRPAPPAVQAAAASSQLAEQNALYRQAKLERQEGRPTAAIATLDQLITTYPQAPLLEDARLEKMRILATTDPARASAAARDYLLRYPRGFGRAEAAALVSGSP